MPSTVLGKRKPVAEEEHSTIRTRAKRRITINEPNDENDNPFITRAASEERDVQISKKTRRLHSTVPAKHGLPESRVSVSTRITSHYHVAKGVEHVSIYEDVKPSPVVEPKTPRHRDALPRKVAVTPRHRILAYSDSPRTPRTPCTPSGSTAVYNHARKLFSRCTNPGTLVGRQDERATIASFIQGRITQNSGGCLYISGPPGTGKSALVSEVIQNATLCPNSYPISIVNCMSVRNTRDLSQKLSEDLMLGSNAQSAIKASQLRSYFSNSGTTGPADLYVVVLDEADCLADMDLDLMYSLFEWSIQPDSRLILIGIANALDLTDRLLPRLKSRNLKPDLLPFMPYSAAQIAEILTNKLKSLETDNDDDTIPFIHPAAIQFCAKKVAGQTGDLRKAFDICRRAIDLVEQETRAKNAPLQNSPSRTPLMENINLSSPVSMPSPASPSKKTIAARAVYTVLSAPKVTIAHVAKVTAQVFSNGATQRLSILNLQQKAVLCSLAALERQADEASSVAIFQTPSKHVSSAPSIKQLYSAYSLLCKREQLFPALSNGEFRDVVSGLETLSLLSPADSKIGSFMSLTPSRTPSRKNRVGTMSTAATGDDKKIASVVSVKELDAALEGIGGELLREMLRGDTRL